MRQLRRRDDLTAIFSPEVIQWCVEAGGVDAVNAGVPTTV